MPHPVSVLARKIAPVSPWRRFRVMMRTFYADAAAIIERPGKPPRADLRSAENLAVALRLLKREPPPVPTKPKRVAWNKGIPGSTWNSGMRKGAAPPFPSDRPRPLSAPLQRDAGRPRPA